MTSAIKPKQSRNSLSIDFTSSAESIRKRKEGKELRDEEEVKRHHLELETQSAKLNQAILDEKELDFKIKCINQYEKMKENGYSNDKILSLLPQMKGIVSMDEEPDNDSDTYGYDECFEDMENKVNGNDVDGSEE